VIISIIAAVDQAGGIGKDSRLPWHLSQDLRRFKQLTLGHHIIMGRKTYESIGRPLPGRQSIVITRNPEYQEKSIIIAPSISTALQIATDNGEDEVFVIGGGEIYEQILPFADRIYLTEVNSISDCDTFFPVIDLDEWEVESTVYHAADDKNQFDHTFQLLNRKKQVDLSDFRENPPKR